MSILRAIESGLGAVLLVLIFLASILSILCSLIVLAYGWARESIQEWVEDRLGFTFDQAWTLTQAWDLVGAVLILSVLAFVACVTIAVWLRVRRRQERKAEKATPPVTPPTPSPPPPPTTDTRPLPESGS